MFHNYYIHACKLDDIFGMSVVIPQRKYSMLAREYAGNAGLSKQVSVAHHMLIGLKDQKLEKCLNQFLILQFLWKIMKKK